ncbi:MAG: hypothetical protein A2283_00185 [Lentisphaerae bacterium RIFOXYA12_FULL_48_11]|nr:MAG: hypothetical protein A2283_00185 [Lentisphaerae bacterium RIFOXYA12_FULL_48_11]
MKNFIRYAALALLLLAGQNAESADATNSPVLLIGDSMMKLPGLAIQRKLSKNPDIKVFSFYGIGTGLSRLDAFDWLDKMSVLCREHKPRVAVVAFGANDMQPMSMGDNRIVQPLTEAWDREYSSRLGKAMDILIAGGCRRIVWLALPPMRDEKLDAFVKRINGLAAVEAGSRAEVTIFDAGRIVSDPKTGRFTERLLNTKTAETVLVRDRDGIHLSPPGSSMLADALIEQFWK